MSTVRDIYATAEVVARVRAQLAREPPANAFDAVLPGRGDHALNPHIEASPVLTRLRRAAVLVPLVAHDEGVTILLTQRAAALRDHSGQIAFPGGRIDPGEDIVTAALREAEEEIALPRERVTVIGQADTYRTVTGFQVTPVVGIIPPDLHYHASQDEVSAVFEMPLAEALRLGRYHPLDIHRRGNDHRVWLSWYQHYFVWGMTAGIIRELALQIGARP